MQISITKGNLETILNNLQPFLDKKDSSQIISHIFLHAKEGNLILKATDYEVGLRTQTNGLTILEEGMATVNGKQILDIIRQLKDGEVTLQTETNNLVVKQAKSSFKLNMFNASEFPHFPEIITCSKIDINSIQAFSSMKKVQPVIDMNSQKFEFKGMLLNMKEDGSYFVTTDTRRIAVNKCDNPNAQVLSIIIPKRAITEIQRIFFENVEFYFDEKYIIIKSPNYFFFSKLINGKFVNYENIVDKERALYFTLPKEKIVSGIKIINAVFKDIKMTIRPSEVLFESIAEDGGEAKTQVDVELNIKEEIIIGINSSYVLDFLSQIDTADFEMGIDESNSPFTLRSENLTTVIMPIIL